MNVRTEACFDSIVVYINDIVHIWVRRQDLMGVQSWIMDGRKQFFIEFIMRSNSVVVDYDSRELWELVLAGINKVIVLREYK